VSLLSQLTDVGGLSKEGFLGVYNLQMYQYYWLTIMRLCKVPCRIIFTFISTFEIVIKILPKVIS